MKKIISLCGIVFCVMCASATQYSCLSIITAAKKYGKWDALKSWIAASGLKDEWDKCNYVSDAYPQYAAVTNALVQGGVFTDAEIVQVLAESKDTAIPDDLLNRVYSNDMSNENGRVRWHGKVVRTHYDTNLLVKTWYYPDGYEWKERFEEKRPSSVQSQLTAAEQRELAKRQAEARKAAAEKRKQDRIAMLTTNLTAEVSALMERKRWPEELARLYLLQELNDLRGPVVVTPTLTPQ